MKKAFREQTVSIFMKNFKASSFLLSTNMLHCIFFLVIEYFMDKNHQYYNINENINNENNNNKDNEDNNESNNEKDSKTSSSNKKYKR